MLHILVCSYAAHTFIANSINNLADDIFDQNFDDNKASVKTCNLVSTHVHKKIIVQSVTFRIELTINYNARYSCV